MSNVEPSYNDWGMCPTCLTIPARLELEPELVLVVETPTVRRIYLTLAGARSALTAARAAGGDATITLFELTEFGA